MLSKSQISFSNGAMSSRAPFASHTPPPSTFVGAYGQPILSAAPQATFTFDPRNLEIKTKSVEATLLPLVTQISTLVNFKESIVTGNKPKSERALRAALKVCSRSKLNVNQYCS
jgi:hypothetical protein